MSLVALALFFSLLSTVSPQRIKMRPPGSYVGVSTVSPDQIKMRPPNFVAGPITFKRVMGRVIHALANPVNWFKPLPQVILEEADKLQQPRFG
ncbi:unnamed protein product [Cylicocyclus nassatus]|uniref:Uncharacterized protein n=1 Tax=Cylicocyclus nassatus TaxID=53992 RepID=A0AA36MEM5_CYLNA|nr:unnamed protein product [Cylicocyclus nassatus]